MLTIKTQKKNRPPLSSHQKPWYDALRAWFASKSYAPTLKEWGAMRGMTHKAAWDARNSLEKTGHITFEEGKSRSIQLVA